MTDLFDRVVGILAPYVGPVTARASVTMFIQRHSLAADRIDASHLEDLAHDIRPGLSVFVGASTAEQLAGRIASLGRGGL